MSKSLPHRRPRAAFTLIELLTVIAIIGILASIVIPTVGAVREKAQRAVDANNLREIAKAALLYAADHNDRLPDPSAASQPGGVTASPPAFLWPAVLARQGLLTDPGFYFSKSDPLFNGTFPDAILARNDPTRKTLDPSFTGASPLAWEFVGGLRTGDPASTPIAFTRGLRSDGTWDPEKGVYGSAGGFVAYLDGHVVFYSELTQKLVSNHSGQLVDNLLESLPTASPARVYATASGGLGSPDGVPAEEGP